jgi:2-oxo-4-hydroxy-4-carboxy-5-ureidoimidazoline decarboxylase
MTDHRPFHDLDALLLRAGSVADTLTRDDWFEAFSHHPRIGDAAALATNSREGSEQAGMRSASDDVAARIAAGNAEYERKFGFIYLVCASDKSPEELLEILERRLAGDPVTEWLVAAAEQRQITELRLRALVSG